MVTSGTPVEITPEEMNKKIRNGKLADGVYKIDVSNMMAEGTIAWVERTYKDGVVNGVEKTYINGKLFAEGNYINGKPNGVLTGYYESGKLNSETSTKDGKTDGISKQYYKNGNLKSIEENKLGKSKYIKWYSENGLLRGEMFFDESGKPNSKKEYDDGGNLIRKLNQDEIFKEIKNKTN